MWMIEGFAGGIQPWWHHIGAYHEDRRMYKTAEPVMHWCKANESFLVNRQPIATVGLVWSQRNTDFYGRNDAAERVDGPYTGMMHALVRARIPYLPIHIDDLERQDLSVLILPSLGAMSDEQAASIRRFVERGGSLFATGDTSLYDEWGDARPDFALADTFGAHRIEKIPPLPGAGQQRRPSTDRFAPDAHTYLRLTPELRSRVDGPKATDEPAVSGTRHPVLKGFDETDILPFGGVLSPLRISNGAHVPLTFIPPFPTYPPETAWMRQPKTDIPGLVLTEHGKSRVAYMPADIDRRYEREHLPDHGDLIANIVRWAAGGRVPLTVEGPGLIDCHLYSQGDRVLLHLVNLTSANTWRAPLEELIPVGPIKVHIRMPHTPKDKSARLLVGNVGQPVSMAQGVASLEIPSILDHEVIVIS